MKEMIFDLYSFAASIIEGEGKEEPSFNGSSGFGSVSKICREQAI